MGKLTFALSAVVFLTAFLVFGSDTYITRAIARDPASAPHMAFNAIITRIPMLLISALIIVVFLEAASYPASTKLVTYIVALNLVVSAIAFPLGSALLGLERMTPTFIAGIAEKLITLVLGVGALVLFHQGMVAYAIVALVAAVIGVAAQLWYFMRTVGLSYRLDMQLIKVLYTGGWAFFVWRVSLIFYGTIDITMLSLMTDDKVVGWYGVAYRFIGVSSFFPFALAIALLPALSSAKGEEFRMLASRSLDAVVMASLPIAVYLVVGAGAIIAFLDYGAGFDNTVLPLRILALHIPLTAVSMISGTIMIARDREGTRTRIALAACALNPLLNLAAIPYFAHATGNGATGAAITTVITEVFMFASMTFFVAGGTFARNNVNTGIRCLAAAGVMAGAMLATLPFGLIVMTLVGGFAYATAVLAFGATSITQLRETARLLRSRPQPAEAVGTTA
jgi:O-antigen/teichoic acid export membrane protein